MFVSLSIFFALLFSCSQETVRDTSFIKNGRLRKATRYFTAVIEVNTPGFFLKKGLPTGYHYDLLSAYAKSRGLILKILPFTSIDAAKSALKSGKADILVMENNSIRGDEFRKTVPHWKLQYSTISFANRQMNDSDYVYIPNNLFNKEDLERMEQTYKHIILYDGLNTGILSDYLVTNPNSFAIVQTSVAEAIRLKYEGLNVAPLKDAPQGSWYVSQKCSFLFDLNSWIAETRNSKVHPSFYSSYYQNYVVNKWLSSSVTLSGDFILSDFDKVVKAYSRRIGWDWLLVSALIYQESQFKPFVESHKGAKGLMQVMPATANLLGFESNHTPKENIYIGTKLLARLTKAFAKYPIAEEERYKFVLASYNGGIGHILDAMKLAAKFGRDPYIWENVAGFLRLKRNPEIYNDRVVRFGVFNSNETTRFVDEITERYQNYKALSLSL